MTRSALPVITVVLAVFSLGCDQGRYADCKRALDEWNLSLPEEQIFGERNRVYRSLMFRCVSGSKPI